MKIKTLLIGAALLAAVQPAFAEAQEVTATWAMGGKTLESITSEVTSNNIAASFNLGTDITEIATRDAVNNDGTETLFTATAFKLVDRSVDAEKGNVFENEYIEFVITPESGSFIPKKLSFYAGNFGFGDGRYAVSVYDEDQNVVVASEETPARPEKSRGVNSAEECLKTYSISGFLASSKAVTIRISMWNRNTGSGKRIGFKDVVISGEFYSEGEEPIAPEIPEGSVIAPLENGTFYDVEKVDLTGAKAETDSQCIGSTGSKTVAIYPFYVTEDSDIFFYLATGSTNNTTALLDIFLDGEQIGEHNVVVTNGWTDFSEVSVLPLNELSAGKHEIKITVRECTGYAGNWRVSFHSAAIYNHATIDLTAGTYVNGIRHENSGANVGNIRNGAYAEYKIYIPESGQYAMNIGINPYGEGICTASIKEEGIETSFPIINAARSYSDVRQIPLGDINTPGIKTLRLDFAADHDGYITNYDQLGLERTGNTSGIADAVVTEEVAVEYYNLQGVRVQGDARGTLIRVATAADGSRTATKVVVR